VILRLEPAFTFSAAVSYSLTIHQSINLYSPMQLQANKKEKVWQVARTGNSPTKLATLRQKDRQITVQITTQQKRI